jgi:hypothetical protein
MLCTWRIHSARYTASGPYHELWRSSGLRASDASSRTLARRSSTGMLQSATDSAKVSASPAVAAQGPGPATCVLVAAAACAPPSVLDTARYGAAQPVFSPGGGHCLILPTARERRTRGPPALGLVAGQCPPPGS